MSLTFEVNLSLILSIVAMLSTVVSMVVFVTKLRWDIVALQKEITVMKDDTNAVGIKIDRKAEELVKKMTEQKILNSDEIRHMLVRIDAMDKAIVSMTVQITYISDTIKDLKEKLYKSTAII